MSIYVLKVSVIGANYTGKSALCYAIADKPIEMDYICTIGVDYIIKYVDRGDIKIQLSLWDLAGLERFAPIVGLYVKESPVLFFCYSADSYPSFRQTMDKYTEYTDKGYTDNKHIVVVATKIDSINVKDDYESWAKEFVDEKKCPFVKTSSVTREGIQELIDTCINMVDDVKISQIRKKSVSDRKDTCCTS